MPKSCSAVGRVAGAHMIASRSLVVGMIVFYELRRIVGQGRLLLRSLMVGVSGSLPYAGRPMCCGWHCASPLSCRHQNSHCGCHASLSYMVEATVALIRGSFIAAWIYAVCRPATYAEYAGRSGFTLRLHGRKSAAAEVLGIDVG